MLAVGENSCRTWNRATGKLMIATTVAEVEWLNRAARQVLSSAGVAGPESITVALVAPDQAVESRELRVGEVVRATRNDAATGIFTGPVGTILALDPTLREVTVALDAGRAPARSVTLGPEFLEERTVRGTTAAVGSKHPDSPTPTPPPPTACRDAWPAGPTCW